MTGTVSNSGHSEAPWHLARQLVHDRVGRGPVERIPVAQAHGRVLAEPLVAQSDMPPFAASRIDGWAVCGAGPWASVGDSRAGDVSSVTLTDGQCVHIATGAQLPAGATACLKDEESRVDGDVVHAIGGALTLVDARGAMPGGHDVRPRGYEAQAGDELAPAGTRMTPGVVGVAAGAGLDTVAVYREVTVDLLVFGDELLDSGPSRDGRVRDSLGPQLPGWLAHLGATAVSITHVADTLDAHVHAIASSTADLVVTTGGTAAGPVDHLHRAIQECGGDVIVDAVLVRPGYHQLFATLPGRHLVGLPGNPQSAVIGLLTLGDTFIRARYGLGPRPLPTVPLATAVAAPAREHRFALCRLQDGAASAVEHVDSSMLRGFIAAAGYAIVPPGGAAAGERVEWLALP